MLLGCQYCAFIRPCLIGGEIGERSVPSSLFEHAASAIGDFFVRGTLLLRIDLALAELLLDGIEACDLRERYQFGFPR